MAKKKKENETREEPGAAEVRAQEGEKTPESELEAAETESGLRDELEAARGEAARNWDLYLRGQADMENYRKRAQREKEDLARFANEGILRDLLPVIDNLERAVEHAGEEEKSGSLIQGVEMTLGQFRKVLEKSGVRAICALGEPFDPALHEAMGQIETSTAPPNAVAQELQKGYLLNDRLLRPSLVMVAKAPPASSENG